MCWGRWRGPAIWKVSRQHRRRRSGPGAAPRRTKFSQSRDRALTTACGRSSTASRVHIHSGDKTGVVGHDLQFFDRGVQIERRLVGARPSHSPARVAQRVELAPEPAAPGLPQRRLRVVGEDARRMRPFAGPTRRAAAIGGAIRRCRLVVWLGHTPRRRLAWHRDSPRRGPDPQPDSLLDSVSLRGADAAANPRLPARPASTRCLRARVPPSRLASPSAGRGRPIRRR